MQLNGINVALAFVGQEYVWQRVWAQFGVSERDLDSFFTGPAFLAWQRMGNMQKWAGPLPQHWIDTKWEIHKKVVWRMKELGIV